MKSKSVYDNREWLLDQHNLGKSHRQIAAIAGISTPTVRSWFKKYGIRSRSISEGTRLHLPSKRKWTDDDKLLHGQKMKEVLSTLKPKLSAAQKKNWVENRDNIMAGKLNVANSLEFRRKMSIVTTKMWENNDYRNKVSSSLKEMWRRDDFRAKMAAVVSKQPKISSQQVLLYKYLDELGVVYYKEGPDTSIGWYNFDCLIIPNGDNRKILVEVQGDYWHNRTDTKAQDKRKQTYIERYFPEYDIMYIWEHEFVTKDKVVGRLQSRLGINIPYIDFDFKDVVIIKISAKDANDFLSCYHYIGKSRGGTAYGAYVDNILIAVAVFSAPVRQNMHRFGDFVELSRFCIHYSYHKKNFASWLLSRVLKFVSKTVLAYADTTVGHLGTIYKASNFKLDHIVPADYWYTDELGYVIHKKKLYNQAKSAKMTESEFAIVNGYYKKYGCKKLCFKRETS